MSIGQNYQGSFLVLVRVHFFVILAGQEFHHSDALESSCNVLMDLRVVPGRNCPADKILHVPSDTK
ncbi:MAG: hypothetical protein WAK24_21845 [Candidatus Acidiferrales bacterium]